jgi:hypothetical protein
VNAFKSLAIDTISTSFLSKAHNRRKPSNKPRRAIYTISVVCPLNEDTPEMKHTNEKTNTYVSKNTVSICTDLLKMDGLTYL